MFPCYAPRDRRLAEECAALLERAGGFRVFLEDGELQPGEDVVSKAADALSADVMLIFLSQEAAPERWHRPDWESAFLAEPREGGVLVGFILSSECQYPGLLVREKWFDATASPRAALRAVKRWLRTLDRVPDDAAPPAGWMSSTDEAEVERLTEALSDVPGVSASVYPPTEFLRRCAQDFDGVFSVFLEGRTIAEGAGDLGSQLGMRLEGEAASNLRRIREVCAGQRCLLVVYGAEDAAWIPGGLCSV
ncbi:MAG: toll/interleukin-1 receptor domain-containing protein, partial [Bryobacteraceae bacterium]